MVSKYFCPSINELGAIWKTHTVKWDELDTLEQEGVPPSDEANPNDPDF